MRDALRPALRLGMLALLAGGVVIVQTDRRARYVPELAGAVPAGLGGFADEQRLRLSLTTGQGDIAQARVQAADLVQHRPIPADHLTNLAIADALAGDEAGAQAALETASRRGWRDPLPQIASAQAALDQRAYPLAAQRLAALLATGQLADQTQALLLRLVAVPEGREALARLYAGAGYWQPGAMRLLSGSAPPAQFADWTARIRRAGGDPDCAAVANAVERYGREGVAEAGRLFARSGCAV